MNKLKVQLNRDNVTNLVLCLDKFTIIQMVNVFILMKPLELRELMNLLSI